MATAAAAGLKALVIGGTGATGKCLMGVLLRDKEHFEKVVLVTRRKLENVAEEYQVDLTKEEENGRLVQHVQDLDEITKEKIVELCTGCHVFFNTLGTTRAAAGSSQAFYHIDCEIPFKFAEAAKEAGVSHMSLLTSFGSKTNSMLSYLRTKGELEEKVRALKFPHTTIFRPGGLNRGQTDRFFEKVAMFFIRGLPVSSLAAAMAWNATVCAQKGETSGDPTVTVIEGKQTFIEHAQEYQKSVAPKTTKEEKAGGTQPKEGESSPQAQQRKPEDVQPQEQPQAVEPQLQAKEPEPQAEPKENQPQAKEPEPQAEPKENQPQAKEPEPQAKEPEPQAKEPEPKAEEPEPQPSEPEPQPSEPEPQAKEPEPQAEEPEPQAKEPEPKAEEPEPQPGEPEPQAKEPEPQAEEGQSQAKEDQSQSEEAQPQAKEDEPQVDESQEEDTDAKAKETETNSEDTHPEGGESSSPGDKE